jgi:hypothetical protein
VAVDVLGDRALDTFEHLYVGLQVRRPGLNGVLEMWPNVGLPEDFPHLTVARREGLLERAKLPSGLGRR